MSSGSEDTDKRHVFLSIVSHELKTPLTSIQGFTQAMQRKVEQKLNVPFQPRPFSRDELKKHKEHLDTVMSQIKRINKLVDDLLDVSVIESGQLSYDWSSIDLSSLLRAVCDQLQVFSHHTIRLYLPPFRKMRIVGDAPRLEKLFSNIMVNAIKYSPLADAIDVEAEDVGDIYVIRITDYGIGIPIEDRAHIFDLYYRGKRIDKKKFSGIGLGLYLSREIVEMHKGEISFESQQGVKTTFFVSLPKAQEKELL